MGIICGEAGWQACDRSGARMRELISTRIDKEILDRDGAMASDPVRS
jgi:hypothetical protein